MGSQTSKIRSWSRNQQLQIPKYDLNHFGVITVLFNPIKYKSRYESYHKFDEHMSRSGVTLLTVECIFEKSEYLDLPIQKFEVTRPNDPRHLQINAPSVLWMKENLINIAVKRLPSYIEYVAWLDADIEFENLDWPHLTIYQLQQYSIVQLFQLCSFLGPLGKKQVLRQDYSFAYAIRHDQRLDPYRASECFVHPGYGWAMRRSTFEAMGGLLDFAILGSGDIHFAYALINRIDETIPTGINEDYRRLAKIWGEEVARLAHNGSHVSYIPVNIWHYWHGNRVNRGYFERWLILERCQFSPLHDLEQQATTSLLRLKEYHHSEQTEMDNRLETIEKHIISYFRSRNEDSLKKPLPLLSITASSPQQRLFSHDLSSPVPSNSQTSWTMDIHRIHNDNQSEAMYPLYHLNGTRSPSVDFLHSSIRRSIVNRSYFRRNQLQDCKGQTQLIYYDDEYGRPTCVIPEEISF